eukprot:g2820.t1
MSSSTSSSSIYRNLSSLKSTDKSSLEKFFQYVFRYRDSLPKSENDSTYSLTSLDSKVLGTVKLSSSENEMYRINTLAAANVLIQECLRKGPRSATAIEKEIGNQLADPLVGTVANTIFNALVEWRNISVGQHNMLPKLVDVQWRVGLKTASDEVSNMAVPSVIVELKTQPPSLTEGVLEPVENVQFELEKTTLGTMIDGMSKIRDQLASISG